jgi:pyridoxal phosphate enzyme (YggS family)
MAEAVLQTGRNAEEISLIAVSKTFPLSDIQIAMDAGQMDFGENRVEEALGKMSELTNRHAVQPRWHLIGHVQSRKARDAAGRFDLIHSVDSFKLAQKLSLACPPATPQAILLECNVSGEASKDGFAVAGWERDADVREAFFAQVEPILALPNLRVQGLMTIAPVVETPAQARPFFASLRALRDALRERFPQADWKHLSMGMTDDFPAAIAEGATLIRVGRAIFGSRE